MIDGGVQELVLLVGGRAAAVRDFQETFARRLSSEVLWETINKNEISLLPLPNFI